MKHALEISFPHQNMKENCICFLQLTFVELLLNFTFLYTSHKHCIVSVMHKRDQTRDFDNDKMIVVVAVKQFPSNCRQNEEN